MPARSKLTIRGLTTLRPAPRRFAGAYERLFLGGIRGKPPHRAQPTAIALPATQARRKEIRRSEEGVRSSIKV